MLKRERDVDREVDVADVSCDHFSVVDSGMKDETAQFIRSNVGSAGRCERGYLPPSVEELGLVL